MIGKKLLVGLAHLDRDEIHRNVEKVIDETKPRKVGLEVPRDFNNGMSIYFFDKVENYCIQKGIKIFPLVEQTAYEELNSIFTAINLIEKRLDADKSKAKYLELKRDLDYHSNNSRTFPGTILTLISSIKSIEGAFDMVNNYSSEQIQERWTRDLRRYEQSMVDSIKRSKPDVSFMGRFHLHPVNTELCKRGLEGFNTLDLTQTNKVPFLSRRLF